MFKFEANKKTTISLIFILLLICISFAGCLDNTNEPVEYYNTYNTVRYDGTIYPIGNTNDITRENLNPDVYYPFFKNSINSNDGYYFVNGNGQVFESTENDYTNFPIEITPYNSGGEFDWDGWFENKDNY